MKSTSEIWIAEDDRSLRWVMEKAISREGIEVRSFENGDDLLVALQSSLPEIIISDIRMPGIDGLELLKKIHSTRPDIPVIITTAHSDLDSAVAAYQGGAFEYLPKPFDLDELVDVARRGVTFAREQKPQDLPLESPPSQEIIGEAPAMQEVFRAIGRLSNSNITVLINGESGTGKELVAHALHKHSPRRNSKFIALNMAAIPNDLIESELFGHEKGAFTGAAQRREGRFEQANGGTLFLDEIGDMPPEAQTRLLRVLADGEFYRVGGHTSIKVDVRIIAATHQNLEALVESNRFREDLYHRINVIRVHLPKLSDRREDIPQLMMHFFHRAAKELEMEPKLLSQEAEDFFCAMDWPGNVRQLENICRWLTVMAAGREVLLTDLPPELKAEEAGSELRVQGDWQQMLRRWSERELKSGRRDILSEAVPDFERTMIETALAYTSGRKKDAAELLGWGRNTLTRKLQEYQMENQAL
ncbi:MAG: nitrogen regulation protein NR(I) [Porticoccaceae bacterium]|mgnify:FL=1|jgi:two-component system nitrogen regulation response regulator GlnG|nr:nitrogen regulation protein NR(I) [Porticoccaceae bacterium]MBT6115279.1 nitrogen regulation protein NR(I) [Porticoccaceae bacterium]MBT6594055.1 nitrogen regulation protein NR(I) [Porticoccaceae bacterium]MDB4581024.1 nitrogen regulation protein NR(I) [Porticoccaceae bacterium]MDC0588334.1 nitrogen regulation protein NR(I) [Porticoccaceae bacterium]